MPQAPHKVTRRLRNKVMLLVAYGLGERGIAHELGLDRKTIMKYYGHELEVGRAKMQAQYAEWLYTAASNGNVAAMKYLDAKGEGFVNGHLAAPWARRSSSSRRRRMRAVRNGAIC